MRVFDNNNLERCDSIQGLRAIAFIAIFISHVGFNNLGVLGAWGVSVFFVMSGFLMMNNYIKKNKNPEFGFKFAWSKTKKLYPLHIFIMLFAARFDLYLNGNISKTLFNMGIHTLLIQTWIPNIKYYATLNGPSWYLCTSFFLYLCFPLVLKLFKKYMTKKRAYIWVAGLFLVMVLANICIFCFGNSDDDAWFSAKHLLYYSPPLRFLDFGIGCGLGYLSLFTQERKISPKAQKGLVYLSEIAVLSLLGASIYIYMNEIGALGGSALKYTLLFIPTTVPLVWLSYVEKGFLSKALSLRALVKLGDLSPYTFLIHTMVLRYFAWIVFLLFNLENLYVKAIGSFVCTIIAAIIWTYVDKYASYAFAKIKRKEKITE